MKLSIYLICGFLWSTVILGYTSYELEVPKQKKNVTYYTPDGRRAVTLTDAEISSIGAILKNPTWSHKDYNKRITDSYIRRRVATCQCGDDAALLKRVLKDFKDQMVETLFTALGLRREI